MKKLIAGNWKMNGSTTDNEKIISSVVSQIRDTAEIRDVCDFLICPPSIYIPLCVNDDISIGAQNCSAHDSGAFTGEVSAKMIKDCGALYVIIGHSERRQYHNEDNETVKIKAKKAHEAGLITIICVGESEAERDIDCQEEVVGRQLIESLPDTASENNTVIAYEPVWAIGTGRTASTDDVKQMHSFIRQKLKEHLAQSENIRILYGGSMKPENAKDLLSTANVDGGLIGGASLNADQFIAIARAAL